MFVISILVACVGQFPIWAYDENAIGVFTSNSIYVLIILVFVEIKEEKREAYTNEVREEEDIHLLPM